MDQQQPQQPSASSMVIQLTLTLGEINAMLQAMQKAPYEMSKPLIDKVTEQAQAYVSRMSTQQPQSAPNSNPPIQMPTIKSPLS